MAEIDVCLCALALAMLVIEVGYAAVYDLRTSRIPNRLVLYVVITWFVWASSTTPSIDARIGIVDPCFGILSACVVFIFGFAFTAIFESITGDFGMGGGDVKLLSAIALFLGIDQVFVILLIACVAFVLQSVISMAKSYSRLYCANALGDGDKFNKCNVVEYLQIRMPFGPYICLGTFIVISMHAIGL